MEKSHGRYSYRNPGPPTKSKALQPAVLHQDCLPPSADILEAQVGGLYHDEKPFHSRNYQTGFLSRAPAVSRKCSTAPLIQPSTVVHSTSVPVLRKVCLPYELRICPHLRCLQISWKGLSLALSTTQQSDTIHQNATPTLARPF